ncbi:hypothetical protein KY285_024513 [Solanum tuberosum]|nr:hypothetical protein KY285_024513 [Solanum tuberosum]
MLVKKIVKRCIYGFFLMLYLGRMLKTDYLPFPLPGCIIPLIPAIMGGYLIVFCYNPVPIDLTGHETGPGRETGLVRETGHDTGRDTGRETGPGQETGPGKEQGPGQETGPGHETGRETGPGRETGRETGRDTPTRRIGKIKETNEKN